MSFEKTYAIGDKEVVVRELSVREVRQMSKEAATGMRDDPLAGWLIEDAPFSLLAAMTTVTVEEMEDWRPSEIRKLAECCREVNPDFFGMSARLNDAVRAMNIGNSTAA